MTENDFEFFCGQWLELSDRLAELEHQAAKLESRRDRVVDKLLTYLEEQNAGDRITVGVYSFKVEPGDPVVDWQFELNTVDPLAAEFITSQAPRPPRITITQAKPK